MAERKKRRAAKPFFAIWIGPIAALAFTGIVHLVGLLFERKREGEPEEGSEDGAHESQVRTRTGSQPDGISIGGIGLTLTAVLAAMALTLWLVWMLVGHSDPNLAKGQTIPPVSGTPRSEKVRDLRAMRAREDSVLNGYGWVDRTAGKVRVPINRAMEMAVQRDLTLQGTPP